MAWVFNALKTSFSTCRPFLSVCKKIITCLTWSLPGILLVFRSQFLFCFQSKVDNLTAEMQVLESILLNFFLHVNTYVIAIMLGHFIVDTIAFIFYKHSSLTARIGKWVKTSIVGLTPDHYMSIQLSTTAFLECTKGGK